LITGLEVPESNDDVEAVVDGLIAAAALPHGAAAVSLFVTLLP
jgi:hypothetical protein